MNSSRLAGLWVAAWLALAPLGSMAQAPEAWPTKPVRFLVPFAPGGGTDILARMLATGLEPILGQRLVIENGRCVGVRCVREGKEVVVRARKEVILSAGAIGSPASSRKHTLC